MKKPVILVLCLLFSCTSVHSNEITEDYFDIAANYVTYGQYKQAGEYLDKILEIEPSNYDAAELKNIIGRISNPQAKSYLSTNNKNIKEAFLSKKQGDENKLISALSANQNDFWSCYLLGDFYYNNRNYSEAAQYYKKAVNLKPNYAQSYLGLAQSYAGMKDFQTALSYINKYIPYDKNSDFAYALRAQYNLNLGNVVQAQNDINKAIDIEENISYLLIEAKILYAKGDYETAKEKLSVLSKNVQTSEVYKYLGLCDYSLSNYTNALLNLDKAIILSDEDNSLNAKYNEIKSKLEQQ